MGPPSASEATLSALAWGGHGTLFSGVGCTSRRGFHRVCHPQNLSCSQTKRCTFHGVIPISQGLRFPLSLVPLSLFLLLPRRTSMRFSNGMHSLASVGCEQLSSPTFLNVPSSTDRLRCAENDISSSARLKVPRESDRAPPSPETRLDSVQIPSPPPGSLRGRKFCEGRFVPPCSAAHPT